MKLPDAPIAPGGRIVHPVRLVGAGPGDPELLTLKAVAAIAVADVLLVDDLVDRRVIAHARAGARVIGVGKRGGCRSTPQGFIDRLMVRYARAGQRVVRLKGGDPALFGRAGEEIANLARNGIPWEFVGGITSGFAAAHALGVSLTHRDHSHGVAFVTGHPKPGGDDVDWAALARSGLTLVVYMGLRRAAHVQRRLLESGMAAATPVAVVERASAPDERTIECTLATLAQTVERQRLASPSVIVVGAAAAAVSTGAPARADADCVSSTSFAAAAGSAIRVAAPPPSCPCPSDSMSPSSVPVRPECSAPASSASVAGASR